MNADEALNTDFQDMLRAMNDAGARYLLVGAHAMAVHGVPRATGYIGFFIDPETSNSERVFSALFLFGVPVVSHGVTARDLTAPGTVYQIGLPPRHIDILNQNTGVTFEEAWGARVEQTLGGIPVNVIGREALVKNKCATGREKDLLDLRYLEQAKPG
jgi:hypothetical protein